MPKLARLRGATLPLTLLLICFVWSSIYGLDYGSHWDETRGKFDSIKHTLATGVFLQGTGEDAGGNYNHGGVNYWLAWTGFMPEISRFFRKTDLSREAFSAAITPRVYGLRARLRVRGVYVILCALAIVWLYSLARLLGRSQLEAFLAAAILCASWEFAYHSRWIAPDGLMMQFSLLAFLCLALGRGRKQAYWFYLAAIAAGLAAGTKYTGALTAPFIVMGAAWSQWQTERSPRAVLKQSAALIGIALGTFVITNPAVIIDPFHFFTQLEEQRFIYANGWYGHTVKPGVNHLWEIVRYFALEFFSNYWQLSIPFAIFSLIGLVVLAFERKALNAIMILFTVVYVAFFAQQATMIVRNLLVVAPILCMASARGIMAAGQWMGRPLRFALVALVGISLAVNTGWEIYAARQIKLRRHPEHFANQFLAYVMQKPEETFFVSTRLLGHLKGLHASIPANLVNDPNTPHGKVAFLQTESADIYWERWPTNWWGMYEAIFGPTEVNLEAYSTFIGNQRILLATTDHFKKMPMSYKQLRP